MSAPVGEVLPHGLEAAEPKDDVRLARPVTVVLAQQSLALVDCLRYRLRPEVESVPDVVQGGRRRPARSAVVRYGADRGIFHGSVLAVEPTFDVGDAKVGSSQRSVVVLCFEGRDRRTSHI